MSARSDEAYVTILHFRAVIDGVDTSRRGLDLDASSFLSFLSFPPLIQLVPVKIRICCIVHPSGSFGRVLGARPRFVTPHERVAFDPNQYLSHHAHIATERGADRARVSC